MSYNVVNKQTGEVTQVAGVASGGLTPEEHGWLESLASYTPNMYDINPTQSVDNNYIVWSQKGSYVTNIPICGYAKLSIRTDPSYFSSIYIVLIDGTKQQVSIPSSIIWSDYIDIPNNALTLEITTSSGSGGLTGFRYSLLTKDSPYNPDNQS